MLFVLVTQQNKLNTGFNLRILRAEKDYIQELLLNHFLGLDLDQIKVTESGDEFIISRENRSLVLQNIFFSSAYLKPEFSPKEPLKKLNLSGYSIFKELEETSLFIIYGDGDFDLKKDQIRLGIDIFGSCFFMLSRIEEVYSEYRDNHSRFPFDKSLAFKAGFIDRAIVDEYVELLWHCMKFLWPDLTRKRKEFRKEVSCDVDWPYTPAYYNASGMLKRASRNLLKRRSVSAFKKDINKYREIKKNGIKYDPCFRFSFMMDHFEKNNLIGTFYFIAERPAGKIDGIYDLEDPTISSLMKNILERGHEIGLHPSYTTYNNQSQLIKEKKTLEKTLRKIGFEMEVTKSRQHYLRFDSSFTFNYLDSAGFKSDSSMGFAGHIGFRAGTCNKYPMYDVNNRKKLDIIQSPLNVMEVTLLDEKYMNLSHEQAFDSVKNIVNQCKKYQGNFTFLWHNSNFNSSKDEELFKNILEI